MSLFSIIGTALSTVIGKNIVNSLINAGKNWFRQRQEIKFEKQKQKLQMKQAEHEARLEKIRRDQKLYADADIAAIEQWEYSLIDELFKGTVLMLFWGPFVPPLSPYMLEGAVILSQYPLWIQIIMAGTFISVLGLRYLFLAPLQKIFPNLGKRNT